MSIYMIIPTDKNRHAEWFARIKSLDKRGLLIRIPEELEGIDVKSLEYALTYAICTVRYGVQITPEILENATRLSAQLHEAYLKGRDDERKRFEAMMEENKNEH